MSPLVRHNKGGNMGNAIPFLSRSAWVSIAATIIIIPSALALRAQTPAPSIVDPNLTVSAIATGFSQPIAMAFLGPNDFFVTEKATGQVWRSLNNTRTMVLDLAVNFSSERGLLGIALHPAFPADPGVYLYWTESLTGADSGDLAQVPLLGNRVDRFEWNGSTLTLSTPIAALRAFQADANQPLRGNHDGGIIKFGRDGKLYIFIGDVGRRSWMQNLECGPVESCTEGTVPDD